MRLSRVIEIISALADGVDPYTGEILPEDSPYQNPDTVRALFFALGKLKSGEQEKCDENPLLQNAGKPWTQQEDLILVAEFENGISAKDLSIKHCRTAGAIRSRLIKLGLIVEHDSQKLNTVSSLNPLSEHENKESLEYL